jgi:hypothetical protein
VTGAGDTPPARIFSCHPDPPQVASTRIDAARSDPFVPGAAGIPPPERGG